MLLGSHTLKWLVGVVFIATNQIVAVGEGCWRWAHRIVWCAPDSPVRQTRAAFGFLLLLSFEPFVGPFYWFVLNLWHL
jgi:hypothetical protein